MNRGYTLLEILVALAIFAILATITATTLHHTFETRARVTTQANILNTLQLAIITLEQDTREMVNRPIRGEKLRLYPAVIGRSHYFEFTRGGFPNPNAVEKRSNLKRVAWICSGRTFVRRVWSTLDAPTRSAYHDTVLLDNLETCSLAYLNALRDVAYHWKSNDTSDNHKEIFPSAVRVTWTIQHWGNMSLLFPISEALYGQ